MPTEGRNRRKTHQDSQIIGLRLPRDLAADVKAEAARRHLRLNQLFEEVWANYKKSQSSSART